MSGKNRVAQSAIMISVFTLISKFLGFIREVMIASKFGSGMETDTYFVAMTATVIIVGTLGSALNTTLIPIFSEVGEKYGHKGKLVYLNNIINLVIIVTVIMMILGFIGAPLVVKVLAKGFEGEQFHLAVKLNRIGLPIVMILGLTHVLAGFLNGNQIFGPPAIAGIPYNIVFLVYLSLFAAIPKIETLMLITVIATFFQFLIHVPAVKHMRYKFKPRVDFKDPFLRKAMILIGPVLLGSAVQQINVVIDRTLASELAHGSLSALTYASRINEMVIAVFVMAITTVVFPMLSNAFAKDDTDGVKEILSQGVNIILLVTVPATIGMILLAEPVVYLFFQRGAFTEGATNMTSIALTFYSIGLVGSSLRLMLNRVYYSFQDTLTPMINGAIAVVVNIVFNLILIRSMGHGGLALATSISATVTTILLFISLRKKIGPIGLSGYFNSFLKTTLASLIMGFVVYAIYYRLGGLLPEKKLVQILMLLISIIGGILTYFGMCIILKIEELQLVMDKLFKK